MAQFSIFNIDFTSVEDCIGLSYKALVFFWILVPRILPEKNVSVMIGSLEESTVNLFQRVDNSFKVSPMQCSPPFYQSSKRVFFADRIAHFRNLLSYFLTFSVVNISISIDNITVLQNH